MNYSLGSGIIRLKIHKSFEDIFEVPCEVLRFEVPCGNHIEVTGETLAAKSHNQVMVNEKSCLKCRKQ